jgi:hypothetical protein
MMPLHKITSVPCKDCDILRGGGGVELGVLKTKAPITYKNLFQNLSRYALGFSMCCLLYRTKVLHLRFQSYKLHYKLHKAILEKVKVNVSAK